MHGPSPIKNLSIAQQMEGQAMGQLIDKRVKDETMRKDNEYRWRMQLMKEYNLSTQHVNKTLDFEWAQNTIEDKKREILLEQQMVEDDNERAYKIAEARRLSKYDHKT